MSTVTIRARERDDDPQIVAIFNAADPDFPPTSLEEFRHRLDGFVRPEGTREVRLVAVEAGAVVGYAALLERWGMARPGGFSLRVLVAPSRRGRGVGGRLYEQITISSGDWDVERMYTWVREDRPDDLRFARKHGFVQTGRIDRNSRLQVPSANMDGQVEVMERVRSDGFRITTLAEMDLGDERFMHALHEMLERCERDIPSSEEYTGEPYDMWLRHFNSYLESPGMSPDLFWLAMDGDIPVAMTALRRGADNTAYQQLTATDREYRGRGLARALKLCNTAWAQESGIEYVYTDNDAENTRMLDINIRLGFQPLPGMLEVMRECASQ